MEVCFDATAAEMNQEPGKKRLGNSHSMPGYRPAWKRQRQVDRQANHGTAEEDRRPDVRMGFTGGSEPCARRDPKGSCNARYILKNHQACEQAIGLRPDQELVFSQYLFGSENPRLLLGGRQWGGAHGSLVAVWAVDISNKGQP